MLRFTSDANLPPAGASPRAAHATRAHEMTVIVKGQRYDVKVVRDGNKRIIFGLPGAVCFSTLKPDCQIYESFLCIFDVVCFLRFMPNPPEGSAELQIPDIVFGAHGAAAAAPTVVTPMPGKVVKVWC